MLGACWCLDRWNEGLGRPQRANEKFSNTMAFASQTPQNFWSYSHLEREAGCQALPVHFKMRSLRPREEGATPLEVAYTRLKFKSPIQWQYFLEQLGFRVALGGGEEKTGPLSWKAYEHSLGSWIPESSTMCIPHGGGGGVPSALLPP